MERIRAGEELEEFLTRIGANPRRTSKGWSVRCLYDDHDDKHNSGIVFDDGWFHCFGGCRRINVLGHNFVPKSDNYQPRVTPTYTDYFDYWLGLDHLDEGIKGLPASLLNSLGWRKLPSGNDLGTAGGIFIPYFTPGRNKIPFYQIRHSDGNRRFSFAQGATPIANGFEALKENEKFLTFTEGCSDRAVLAYCGVSAIALPSASSGTILKGMAAYAKEHGLVLVACSDNDDAGNRLLSSLTGIATYIDMRPPTQYKDFGEMFEAVGAEPIQRYLSMLIPKKPTPTKQTSTVTMLTPEQAKEAYPELWKIMTS